MRGVPPTLDRCELTYREREPIDLGRAVAQHAAYADLLRSLGLEVVELPADPAFPTAASSRTRPSCSTRRRSCRCRAPRHAGARCRRWRRRSPATAPRAHALPGDARGRGRAARRPARSRRPLGPHQRGRHRPARRIRRAARLRVVPVAVTGCLHLKSAVTALDDERVLANPRLGRDERLHRPRASWRSRPRSRTRRTCSAWAGLVVAHAGFPRTLERLVGARLRRPPARRLGVPEGGGRPHLQEPALPGLTLVPTRAERGSIWAMTFRSPPVMSDALFWRAPGKDGPWGRRPGRVPRDPPRSRHRTYPVPWPPYARSRGLPRWLPQRGSSSCGQTSWPGPVTLGHASCLARPPSSRPSPAA